MNTESSRGLLYLMGCGLKDRQPEEALLQELDPEELYRQARRHSVTALVCTALEGTAVFRQAGPEIRQKFLDRRNQAICRAMLFDAERRAVSDRMEALGIWHVALKGSLLQNLYPKYGSREMADVDMLIDPAKRETTRELFVSRGYRVESYGEDIHDVPLDVLRGGGPRDLRDLCVNLASELYEMSGRGARADGFRLAEVAIDDGAAYDVFIRWISAQGGDPSVFDGDGHLPVAPMSAVVRAERDGWISRTDSEKIGTASLLLGAGRAAPGDAIDHSAGIVLCRKAGELVKRGDELCVLYSSCSAAEAEAMLREAIVIGDAPVSEHPLIIDRIG